MLTVSDESFIAEGNLVRVFECFWNASLWPQVTPHVKRIQMLEEGPARQRFLMTVESRGVEHTVESLREAEAPWRIRYQQVRPPVFLESHQGEWRLRRAKGGTRLTLVHRAVLNAARAREVFGVDSDEAARASVSQALRANGLKTVNAVKVYLERGSLLARERP